MELHKKYIVEIVNIINSQNYENNSKNREFLERMAFSLKTLSKSGDLAAILALLLKLKVGLGFDIGKPAPKPTLKMGCISINVSDLFNFRVSNLNSHESLKMLPKL
ncbi:hypothetical protein H6G80_03955 [Nostoc sp. FACHB-87]|uniref:hypothetical protein n=1 Tax=Nostocaceae TaxID=1162 RepID=UPI00168481BC|nr:MULTISPECIES: hypothetical protein [Nostocaceae]MBD2453229.1 hypothetical protein [Nostoc sp. FACHB-87]MBD2474991.1 hypothetical protein [Anabaena sp. FACHB-83]